MKSLFPSVLWKSLIKSCWPSEPDSLGIPSPFAILPDWEAWCGVQTFITAGELLQYYCSPVYRSPTWWVWGLILPWLYPTYCFIVASPLSLDVGYHLWWHPEDGCLTASCNFSALMEGDESTCFYSAILNQSSYYSLTFKMGEVATFKSFKD